MGNVHHLFVCQDTPWSSSCLGAEAWKLQHCFHALQVVGSHWGWLLGQGCWCWMRRTCFGWIQYGFILAGLESPAACLFLHLVYFSFQIQAFLPCHCFIPDTSLLPNHLSREHLEHFLKFILLAFLHLKYPNLDAHRKGYYLSYSCNYFSFLCCPPDVPPEATLGLDVLPLLFSRKRHEKHWALAVDLVYSSYLQTFFCRLNS